ncbi:MAG: type II secretion system protein [Patescibacteria group bacterium]
MKNVNSKGFTMIELLIVIAIIGALAVAVFVGLNPIQRLAQTRDSGRLQNVVQLGRAAEAYAVGNNGSYVAEANTWIDSLVTAGELTTAPQTTTYSIAGMSACATNVQNTYCYDATTAAGGGPVIVFSRLESTANNSRCAAGTPDAFAVYSTADGRGGIVCVAAAGSPAVPAGAGSLTFLP